MRFFKQQIDRWAIRSAARSLPCITPRADQAPEVADLLSRADLFKPAETPAKVTLDKDFSFSFPSGTTTPFPRNNIAWGRIFPASAHWRKQASVILLHGWNAEMHYTALMPKLCRSLNRRGLNGVMLELPYHLQRRPVRGETISNFISEDIPRMLEAVRQAISDLNALIWWLKEQGNPRVAICGFSLGAWLVGLHLCESAAQDIAVLVTPVSNLERAVAELAFCHPIRAALKVAPADLGSLNLEARRPQITPEKIHLVEAKYDLFVPADTYRELASAWDVQGWERLPESHITILFSRSASARIVDWLASHL